MSKPTGAGNAGSSTVQTTGSQAPPQWVQNANQDLYTNSQQVADKLGPQQFAAPAALTGGQNSLIQSLMGNVGSQNGTYSGALNTLSGLQSFAAPNVSAGQLKDTDLSPYMNPYTQSVIDTTMATGKQALAQAQNQGADSAAGAGAFGGSRQGVQAGVTGSQYALGQAGLAAQLNAANFNQAQGAASSDIGTRLAADTTNAGNSINSAGLRLNASNSAISGAGQQQQTYLNSLMAALAGQGMVQGQQQQQNQYTADTANAWNQLPTQRLGVQSGTLNGLNVGSTSTGTQTGQTQQPGNTFGQILGGGLGLVGSLASAGGKNGFNLFG